MHEKPSSQEVDPIRFEKAKLEFLKEIEESPEKDFTKSQIEGRMHFVQRHNMVYAVLDFLSLYGVEEPFKKIELEMEKVMSEKVRQDDPDYIFADGMFSGGYDVPFDTQSPWEMTWGSFGIYGSSFDSQRISITEEEKINEVFSETRLWRKRLKPEVEKSILPKFKHPDNEGKAQLVFRVSKDIIQALK